MVRGNKNERKLQWETEAHVYITTYETIREDIDSMADGNADVRSRGRRRSAKDKEFTHCGSQSHAFYRLCTALGTLRNAIREWAEELVSVFAFIKPGLLVSDRETAQSIKHKIAPFF